MEDQDRETRIDEDVEGHQFKQAKARAYGKDEGDDVDAHAMKGAAKGRAVAKDDDDDVDAHAMKGAAKGRAVAKDDEDDDVDAHQMKNQQKL